MMLMTIQAYFPTENEAEAVKAMLVSYETKSMEISRLGNTSEERDIPETASYTGFQKPLGSISSDGIDGSVNGGIISIPNHIDDTNAHHKDMKYVLSTKVNEEDYEAIVEVIKDNKGKL